MKPVNRQADYRKGRRAVFHRGRIFLRQSICPHPPRATTVRHYADNMPNLRVALFPTGPTAKYCDRFNEDTKCIATRALTPRSILVVNRPAMSRSIYRERPKRHMKRAQLLWPTILSASAALSSMVLARHTKRTTLISDELYRTWLSIVNQPNCRAKIKRPDRTGTRTPVLWYGRRLDGNRYAQIEFPAAEYPALFERLSKLAESPQSKCTLDYLEPGEHPCSSWHIKLYEFAGCHRADK